LSVLEGKLTTALEACQKMRACVYRQLADRAAFAAQSHRQAQLVLPAGCYRRRASSARREGAARTFFGGGRLPGECLKATRGLVGPQNHPLFSKAGK
jgi:hypothetical protein